MHFEEAIKELAHSGLNLFGAIPFQNLTSENKVLLKKYSLEIEEDDCLCLVAHGGIDLWKKLPSPPIDEYSIQQVKKVFPDAAILFPGDQLYPLQQIGRMMNMGDQSPIGIDINADFGLWFAYRCLFTTKEKIPLMISRKENSICESCAEKICLTKTDFYEARLSCPYKAEHRYSDEQLCYHKSQLP